MIYGRGKETQSLLVDGRQLRQVLAMGGANVLIDLQIGDGARPQVETVMLKEIQRHLFHQDRLLHVDFIRISMEDEIEVNVPLNFTGEAAGVAEGGILQVLAREVSIKCLPGNIPEFIEADISALQIGDGLTAGTLQLPEGVTLLSAPEEVLVQVLVPEAEEVPAAAEEAEGAAEEEKKAEPPEGEEAEG